MTHRIQCQALVKSFAGIRALRGLDMDIDISVPTGLVGANGAGKSTLFAILCGFIRPSQGTVRILDMDVREPGLKGRISILPQDTSMFRGIAVHEQLCHYALLQGMDRQVARAETSKVLERVAASALARQYPETLSFGQRKKVLLAQALIGSPSLLLLDEPTAGLDPVVTTEIHKLLQQLAQDYSLFISSHNVAEIEDICRNIVVLNQGKLVRTGTISDIKRAHQCFRLRLEAAPAGNVADILAAIPGVTRVEETAGDGRQYTVFYAEGSANDVQFAVIGALQKLGAGIDELRKGSDLADEISSLLKA